MSPFSQQQKQSMGYFNIGNIFKDLWSKTTKKANHKIEF